MDLNSYVNGSISIKASYGRFKENFYRNPLFYPNYCFNGVVSVLDQYHERDTVFDFNSHIVRFSWAGYYYFYNDEVDKYFDKLWFAIS